MKHDLCWWNGVDSWGVLVGDLRNTSNEKSAQTEMLQMKRCFGAPGRAWQRGSFFAGLETHSTLHTDLHTATSLNQIRMLHKHRG